MCVDEKLFENFIPGYREKYGRSCLCIEQQKYDNKRGIIKNKNVEKSG